SKTCLSTDRWRTDVADATAGAATLESWVLTGSIGETAEDFAQRRLVQRCLAQPEGVEALLSQERLELAVLAGVQVRRSRQHPHGLPIRPARQGVAIGRIDVEDRVLDDVVLELERQHRPVRVAAVVVDAA